MNEYDQPDYWDPDSYRTGSTKPPKSHGGILAVLLILVILLGGISSALGILNIRLFSRLERKPTVTGPLAFSPTENTEVREGTEPVPTVTRPGGDIALQLQPTPEKVDNVPQIGGLSLQEIYDKAIDSVVSITCTLQNGSASGTGVVLSRNGYLVTNCHVVEGARAIRARFTDERVMTAAVVGADPVSDLAVLYVDAQDLIPAEFGESAGLRVGDAVAAIGDPLGETLRGTMTDGIISAINRDIVSGGRTMTLIQTNAALNSGNSGGPLLNCFGQVIGINTMKISAFVDDAGVEGLGFAIPSATVKQIVDQLIAQGYVSGRPSLDLEGETVSDFYQRYYGLPAGYYVTAVDAGGTADQAGIAPGDILISVNGTRITGSEELNEVLYACQAGDTVELTVYRSRRQYTVKVTLSQAGAA